MGGEIKMNGSTWKQAVVWTALMVGGVSVIPAQAADPALTWLGHAAFKYSTRNGKVLLIDPWTTNPKAPKKLTLNRVDGILVTHGHSDHVGEAFELAKKHNVPLIASFELTQIALKHGVKDVLPLNPSGSTEIAGVKVTAVQAVHSSSFKEGENLIYAGAPLGFVLEEYGSLTLYHAGDTGVFEDMAMINQIYQPQIVMLPIGGVYTMKPIEAARAAGFLSPRTVIPMHYGTFPALTGAPEELKKEMARLRLPAKLRELTPGEEVKVKDLQ
jgi:L-ascorbate metabolism protein UlaG (beta-lactamase superfamily)